MPNKVLVRAALACVISTHLLLACGGGGGGGAVDAGDTSDASDATPANGVTITVREDGIPLAAVAILLSESDGSLIETALTDSTGSYTFTDVVAGSSVSALVLDNGKPRLLTTFGVEPGDSLVLEREETEPFAATFEFNLPVVGGATTYRVSAGCSPETVLPAMVETVGVTESCIAGGATSLLATALDGADVPIKVAVLEDVTIADGETKNVVFPAWADPPPSANISFTDVNPAADNAALTSIFVRDGFTYLGQSLNGPPGGDTVALDVVPPPASFYDSYVVTGGFSEDLGGNAVTAMQIFLFETGALTAKSYALDDLRMPRVAGVVHSWPSGGTRPKLTMVEDGATNNLVRSSVIGSLDFDTHVWHFIAPPGTTEAQLPEIPNGWAFTTNYPAPPKTRTMGSIRVEAFPDYQSYRNATLSFRLGTRFGLDGGGLSLSAASDNE